MHYNFNDSIDLRQSNSTRWNTYGDDILPLWVADMDFALAPPIKESIHAYTDRFSLVYHSISEEQNHIICQHLQTRYHWCIQPEWIVWIPGVVSGIHAMVRSCSQPRSGVITPTPVYPPFFRAAQERTMIEAPLTKHDGKWHWNLPEPKGNESILLLCHPHNPTGKVFNRNELERISDYCCTHDLLVCSDEIYADLILDDLTHIPIATVNDDIEQRSITLLSAGKTWNISGMDTAFAIVPNDKLREKFLSVLTGVTPKPNVLGVIATCSAYADCADWRLELLNHLRANRKRVDELVSRLPKLHWIANQATFLAWLECVDLSSEQAFELLLAQGLAVSQGTPFGDSRYIRLNIGCTSDRLDIALNCLQKVFG